MPSVALLDNRIPPPRSYVTPSHPAQQYSTIASKSIDHIARGKGAPWPRVSTRESAVPSQGQPRPLPFVFAFSSATWHVHTRPNLWAFHRPQRESASWNKIDESQQTALGILNPMRDIKLSQVPGGGEKGNTPVSRARVVQKAAKGKTSY